MTAARDASLPASMDRYLRTVARLVPTGRRGDWLREWRAEAAWRVARRGDDAVLRRRLAGALIHAMWLRLEPWRNGMLWQDIRHGWRSLAHRPVFTAVTVLTLAIGIGANTAIFTVVDAVLLRPLPYAQSERLVQFWETNPDMGWTDATIAPANLRDWQAQALSFDGWAVYMGAQGRGAGSSLVTLSGDAVDAEVKSASRVSAAFFDLLGVKPLVGRTFRPDDDEPGARRTIVLSHRLWRQRFGGDPAIVGRTVQLNGTPAEVVGVMPATFVFDNPGIDLWTPLAFGSRDWSRRQAHYVRAIARLAPGVTLEQAQAEMDVIARGLERAYPETNTHMGVGVGPLKAWFVGPVRAVLLAFAGALGLVLLIVCANVAGLLLARGLERGREMAVRMALGANRLRLMRQLLAESLLLSALGAAAGLALATGLVRVLVLAAPPSLPRLAEVGLDWRATAFVGLLVIATTVLVGLMPALRSTRDATADALHAGTRSTSAGAWNARRFLVIGEVAVAVVLLAAAALTLRSLDRLLAVDPGFEPSGALTFHVALGGDRYGDDGARARYFDGMEARLRQIPGVAAAGASTRMALEGYNWTGDLAIERQPQTWGRELRHKEVTDGYFEAIGVPIVAGRGFGAQDTPDSPLVSIVNQALVDRYFAGADPIGQRIAYDRPGAADQRWLTIVGVVGDEKQDGLDAPVQPEAYDSHRQSPAGRMTVVVRTAGVAPASLAGPVREALAELDPQVPPYDLATLEAVVAGTTAPRRFSSALIAGFAATALALAGVGLFGVISMGVARRTREIGIRVALGATRRDVVRLVGGEAARLVLVGLALGLAGSITALGLARRLWFEVTPTDPAALSATVAVLVLTATVAAFVPLRRALGTDPAVTLRAE